MVDEHYPAFNSSLQDFSLVQGQFSDELSRTERMRKYIGECRHILSKQRDNLKALYSKKLELSYTVFMLEKINELRNAPRNVDQHLKEFRYISAVEDLSKMETILETGLRELQSDLTTARDDELRCRKMIEAEITKQIHICLFLKNDTFDRGPKGDRLYSDYIKVAGLFSPMCMFLPLFFF